MSDQLLKPKGHVLSTMEEDGSRRWLQPRLSMGKLLERRRLVAWVLIAVFTLVPYVKIGSKPLILFDIPGRRFTIFTYTFLPTDTGLLALLLVILLLSIFFATALFGRVWCGWACPQTVYMEFVYRPIERFFDGLSGRGGKSSGTLSVWRWLARTFIYFLISVYLAHTFLAYFVGVENLFQWVVRSPLNHPIPFLVMVLTTIMMMFDFCFFREQLCIIACPYGRLQSVLLDRFSLIVSYDKQRGEPRGFRRRQSNDAEEKGDCVDCGLCVSTCPTGIDIRDGLQMECINCTQCIDACNSVMTKTGNPQGLIRYSSQAAMERDKSSKLRPRVIVYPTLVCALLIAFVFLIATKKTFDVQLLRNLGNPFTVNSSGEVQNVMRLKITNRAEQAREFSVSIIDQPGIVLPDAGDPIQVGQGQSHTESVMLKVPPGLFSLGILHVRLRVADSSGGELVIPCRLLGPTESKIVPSNP